MKKDPVEEKQDPGFIGKLVAPIEEGVQKVGKVTGKIAKPIGDVAGTIAPIATAASFVFPELAPVAAGVDAVSLGAGVASSASKVVDGDPET